MELRLIMDLEERIHNFRIEVIRAGGTMYTSKMIIDFTDFWSEPDRAKRPKLKFEKEKTWKTEYRLRTWADRCKYNPYLSEGQKTLAEKRRAFAITLEPYLIEYGKELLNSFYKFYTELEANKKDPLMRFERELFWDVEKRLERWRERNNKPIYGTTK